MKYLNWIYWLRGDWWDQYWNTIDPMMLGEDAMLMWFSGGEL